MRFAATSKKNFEKDNGVSLVLQWMNRSTESQIILQLLSLLKNILVYRKSFIIFWKPFSCA